MHLEEVAALSGAAAAGAGAGGSGGACRVQLQWLYEEAVDSFGGAARRPVASVHTCSSSARAGTIRWAMRALSDPSPMVLAK
jgi:hypothetical protein